MSALLKVEGLSKSFGGVQVITDVSFEAEEGAGPLGLVAENAALVDGLRAGLGCELVPAGVTGLRRDEHSAMELDLEGGGVLRARLVVGADGGRSRVRTMAGIRTAGWGYGQRGVVATVATAGPPNEAAWQRFLPTGPLALLPVRDGYSNVVWSTTPAHARELEAMGRAEFGAAVTEALHGPGGGWGGARRCPCPPPAGTTWCLRRSRASWRGRGPCPSPYTCSMPCNTTTRAWH